MKNIITREMLYDLLEDKLKVEIYEEQELVKIIEELYDLTKKSIIPLTEEETFVFRKRYGILDNDISNSKEFICKEYNLGYRKYSIIMERIFVKLLFRVKKMSNYTKKERINSLNIKDEEILNTLISSFPINTTCKNKLMKAFIFTLQDLMEYSTYELKEILGSKEYNSLITYIHSLNYKFLNELSDEEKKAIIDNNDIEIVGNSNPYFISRLDKYPVYALKKHKIDDIKSLVKNVFKFPTKDRIEMMKFISENNLSCLGKEEESKKL